MDEWQRKEKIKKKKKKKILPPFGDEKIMHVLLDAFNFNFLYPFGVNWDGGRLLYLYNILI